VLRRYRFAIVAALTVVAAIVLRVYIYRSSFGYPESDEAVVGLMATSIRHGARPTFYWGQSYGGTLEPAITSVDFAVFGTSRYVLKLVPTLLAVPTSFLLWRVGRRTIREPAAGFVALLALVYPPYFAWTLTKALAYYATTSVLCVALLLLALRLR